MQWKELYLGRAIFGKMPRHLSSPKLQEELYLRKVMHQKELYTGKKLHITDDMHQEDLQIEKSYI